MAEQITKTSVDLLDGTPTGVSGQGVLPELQNEVGKDAVSETLSKRHEEFCWAFVQFAGHGAKAYQDVYRGCKPSTARVNASKLLTNTAITQRIEEILEEKRKRRGALVECVIDYHQAVMNLDRFELLDPETGRVKKLDDLPPEAREVIEVEQVSAKDGVRTLLKIPTRHSSAQELARVLGMNKESMELSGPNGGPVAVSQAGNAEALEKLRQAFDKHVTSPP